MARRRKGSVSLGRGAMCNICGLNCGKGGALKKHIENAHQVDYLHYKRCFYGCRVLADTWDDSIRTAHGATVLVHTLVRRIVGDPGPRGATRAAARVSIVT